MEEQVFLDFELRFNLRKSYPSALSAWIGYTLLSKSGYVLIIKE